jgi:hypothetical protein
MDILLVVLVLLFIFLWARSEFKRGSIPGVAPKGTPTIVVNMPADAKPLEQLTSHPEVDVTISSPRAVLWWTVFNHAVINGDTDTFWIDAAVDAANAAVDKAYGPLP